MAAEHLQTWEPLDDAEAIGDSAPFGRCGGCGDALTESQRTATGSTFLCDDCQAQDDADEDGEEPDDDEDWL